MGAGPATLTDVVKGAITAAAVGSAGDIARAVAQAPLAGGVTGGVGAANASTIGTAAITAAQTASPGNQQNAYSDIAYKLALTTGADVGFETAAIQKEVLAIGTGPRTFESLESLVPTHRLAGCRLESEKFWRGIRSLHGSVRSSVNR